MTIRSALAKLHALELFGQIPSDGFMSLQKPSVLTLKTKQGPVNIVGIPWPSRANIALTEQHTQTSSIDLATQISEAVSSKIEELARSLHSAGPGDPCRPSHGQFWNFFWLRKTSSVWLRSSAFTVTAGHSALRLRCVRALAPLPKFKPTRTSCGRLFWIN